MTNLSVKLAKARLLEADEVKKATAAKLKNRNSGKKEIKSPTAGLGRSERFDNITQIVQDGKFTAVGSAADVKALIGKIKSAAGKVLA